MKICEAVSELDMIQKAKDVEHDMIICLFLTKRVPMSLWENQTTPCLSVHPRKSGGPWDEFSGLGHPGEAAIMWCYSLTGR